MPPVDPAEFSRLMAAHRGQEAFQACFWCRPREGSFRDWTNLAQFMDACGRWNFQDREILQSVYVHGLARLRLNRVVFLGTFAPTVFVEHYFLAYNPDIDYITVDRPNNEYGAGVWGSWSGAHFEDGGERFAEHVEPRSVDLVIAYGIVGWGMDGESAIDAFFQSAHRAVKPGGLMYLHRNLSGTPSLPDGERWVAASARRWRFRRLSEAYPESFLGMPTALAILDPEPPGGSPEGKFEGGIDELWYHDAG
jgi:SAM-dependent methyltransferase